VLLSSPSHLGKVGITAYINDLLWAEKELKARLGRETIVRPLPLLLLPGCNDAALIRDLFNLAETGASTTTQRTSITWARAKRWQLLLSMIWVREHRLSEQKSNTGYLEGLDLEPAAMPASCGSAGSEVYRSGSKERTVLQRRISY
jgi:hypothetical protein